MSKSDGFTTKSMLSLRHDHVQKPGVSCCFPEPFTASDVCLIKRKFTFGYGFQEYLLVFMGPSTAQEFEL